MIIDLNLPVKSFTHIKRMNNYSEKESVAKLRNEFDLV